MSSPIIKCFLSIIFLNCLDLKAFEKENVTIRGSFENSRIAFEIKKKATVAFMGGSITEMNGYRPMLMNFLGRRFPQTEFSFINAGISSTCSTTGAFRLHRDVLSHGPIDLFFIEFAVNDDQDANHSYDECILGMEGIIRQIRTLYPKVDVVVTYFVNPKMLAQLQEGKKPTAMAAHEKVLERYQISRVHLARELAHQINKGKFSWEKFGGTHPKPAGNRLCADMHQELLSLAWSGPLPKSNFEQAHILPKNLIHHRSFTEGRFLSPSTVNLSKGWKFSEPDWGQIKGGKRARYLGSPLLHSKGNSHPLRFQFEGRTIGAFILAGPDAAKIRVSIDGKEKQEFELYHHYSRNLHYPRSVIFAKNLKFGKHTIELEPLISGNRNAIRIMEFCIQ